jgi:hypothetical protein
MQNWGATPLRTNLGEKISLVPCLIFLSLSIVFILTSQFIPSFDKSQLYGQDLMCTFLCLIKPILIMFLYEVPMSSFGNR